VREEANAHILTGMCRLFGFRSNVVSGAHGSLVAAENALARQAQAHKDGWGIGYFIGEEAYIMKSDTGAAQDERFDRITRRLQSHAFVVHVRRATVGQVDYLNSHPFRHGNWVFAHNGTIYGFEEMRTRMLGEIAPHLKPLVFGVTDSEHLFYYLVSALAKAGLPDGGRGNVDPEIAANALRHAMSKLFKWAEELGVEAPLINFILTNGRVFFAQRAGIALYMASQKVFCHDYEVCPEPNKICMDVVRPIERLWDQRAGPRPTRRVNHLTIASEPIGKESIWETVPDGALVVLNEALELALYPAPDAYVPKVGGGLSTQSASA
jgi:predicted glutamine amidotransferase